MTLPIDAPVGAKTGVRAKRAIQACALLAEGRLSPEAYQLLPDSVFWLTQRAMAKVISMHEFGFHLTDDEYVTVWNEAKALIEMGWDENVD